MKSYKSDNLPQNPRETANVFSSLMFCFVIPLFFKGRKKKLDECDLYQALAEHKSDYLGEKLNSAWEDECTRKQQKHLTPSLLITLMRVFGLRFVSLGVVLFILEIGLRVTQPLFLGGLVSHYAKRNNRNKSDSEQTVAYLYAIGVILCSAANVLLMHPYMLSILHMGMKIRVAICSLIYRKALRLSKMALRNTTSGQVVNLISNDVGRLDTSVIHMHYLWMGPVEIAIITYFMYREIGVSSLFGVAVMLLFLPLQAYLSKKTSALRLRTALYTDERVRLMNEIISGIQVIKMYAWEKSFGNLIDNARYKELNCIQYINYTRGILQSFILFVTRISVFASLVGFVLLGRLLTADKAFVITAYYNILRTTMTIYFPMGVSQFAESLISVRRIQKYMMLQEIKIYRNSTEMDGIGMGGDKCKIGNLDSLFKPLVESLPNGKVGNEVSICINKFKAKWDAKLMEYTLDNINLKIKNHIMVAIVGPVGAGKSSLIQAILGELSPESGTVLVHGSVSYASQEPWIFTGTIRQNILFGLPMDRSRYRAVLKKCALERDFELFPFGDRTIVGERGASLSGGQKARINLARAAYRKANIYLLDDPLCAIDSQVGRHVFDHCINGILKNDLVLLVTHQLQLLERADLLVMMDRGRITAVGSFETLSKTSLNFAQLMQSLDNNNENKEENVSLSVSDQSDFSGRNSRISEYRYSTSSTISSAGDSLINYEVSDKLKEATHPDGPVDRELLQKYFAASGSYGLLSVMIFFCIGAQVLASGGDYFLSYWVNKNARRTYASVDMNNSDAIDLHIFTAINVAIVAFAVSRSLLFFYLAKRSSIHIHNGMFLGVTGTAMHFFHTNPTGRILNRFSKDINQVDEALPGVVMDVIQLFLALFGIVVVLCLVNLWYLLSTIVISLLFYVIRSFYLNTSRDIKRLEAINRSPIYTHLAASLNGLPTIRAFNAEKVLIAEFDYYQDMHSSGYFMLLATSRAFGYWLDCCCVFYTALIILSFFICAPQNSGDVGLSITQAMSLTSMVQWGMRQSAELENTLTVIERVKEYEGLQPEREAGSSTKRKPPKSWPEQGCIIYEKLSLRYSSHAKAERVLKSLSFEVKSREKVGIVGRTGAGKSSLINALFHLAYNEGSIVIDSWNTRDIALPELRNKISIIPQEPVLFSGTVRFNLDPFNEYTDAKLWEALDEVKMKTVIGELPCGIQSKISEGGNNFSVGQRQLICLARAILRENRILVMDEATANVDPQTDALIQTTIRHKFEQCTVLTIAHRLHTIMDSDKVLVMDAGQIIEYGAPFDLLTLSKRKVFYNMVKQMGNTTFESLLKIAQKAHEDNLKARKLDP